ncbi:efflux RND transporter permease subunit [Desulfobulbus propionicus]
MYALTEYAKTLRWPDPQHPGRFSGVIEAEMVAPSLIDHLSQQGPGTISFEWLMPNPPSTRDEARMIRDKALSNPLLKGQMISADGKALCIALPLTNKLASYRIYQELEKKIKEIDGEEEYHIAGLPVAESAVGVEMFKQMTFAAPLTMLTIFGLLYLFFRKWVLIILPMLIATVSVVAALGLMIAFGYPVHILSSMLPIFLMPIAICDSVHILSDFFESYTREKGRRQTIREVMQTLFAPLLYTSLTTAAGFLSFVTTAIPPARVFGVFVAIGVMIAWMATITLVPAYVMMLPERMLENFGKAAGSQARQPRIEQFLQFLGRLTSTRAKLVLGIIPLLIVLAVWGIARININDNYAKRFSANHPIRQADTAINSHFGGTYTAYLIIEGTNAGRPSPQDLAHIEAELTTMIGETGTDSEAMRKLAQDIAARLPALARQAETSAAFWESAIRAVEELSLHASKEILPILQEIRSYFDLEKERRAPFKRPEVLEYLAGLQSHLVQAGLVGKCTSVADVVRKVNQELIDGKEENFRIPNTTQGVAECYLQYQQGHRPNDLWHLVTPDFMAANIWIQFTRGDSTQTDKAVKAVDSYFSTHPPPAELSLRWAGLHYVNLVFQEIMFWQMLGSFAGTVVIVFVMMVVLFRSLLWAVAAMIPLTLTIAAIYGVTGLVGKDYDMPVAVMSAITLGIAIDFAVHFLERSRQLYRETGNWPQAVTRMFGEPALAISRNVLVVALGFLPLMVAQLVPYKTTAVLLFGILFFSGLMTLLLLPALLTVAEPWFFRRQTGRQRIPAPGEETP